MTKTILSKQTKDGRMLTVTTDDGTQLVVTVGGSIVYRGPMSIAKLPKSPTGMPEITHHLGGKVGLKTSEAEQVRHGMQSARTEWESTHPIETPERTLAEQRQDIVDRIADAEDMAERAYWRANAQEVADSGWGARKKYDEQSKAARGELAEFDSKHPEIIAAIRAERAEAAERFARTN